MNGTTFLARLLDCLIASVVLFFASGARPEPLNFVVVMSDDQPFHTMDENTMPNLMAWAQQGIRFERAYVSNPLCGPVRASFLSGGFEPRETGVTWNALPQGGVQRFNDRNSLGTQFQGAGYATAHIGKYINGYQLIRTYVPPGWTLFVENLDVGSSDENPSVTTRPPERDPHRLYHYRDYALEFLDTHGQEPFLLVLSVTEPHWPATPAPGDEDLFPDFVYRDRGFGEVDLSDKPDLIQTMAPNQCCPPHAESLSEADEYHRDVLRSLVGLDRVVEDLRQKLENLGVLDRTVFIYLSDNGMMWGEHQHWAKDYAYEESLRVPMVVVAPGTAPRVDSSLVVANLDIPATLYDLAGIETDTDGLSLAPLLENPNVRWPNELSADFAFTPFIWAGLVTDRYKYVEWAEGDIELYDLWTDPFELESLHADPDYILLLELLSARRASYPRTVAFKAPRFRMPPAARAWEPYSYTLPVWGGTPPYSFRLESGSLPPGISLDPSTGTLAGIPTRVELASENSFYIEVQDSSVTRHNGGPQIAVKEISLWTLNPVPEPDQIAALVSGSIMLSMLARRR